MFYLFYWKKLLVVVVVGRNFTLQYQKKENVLEVIFIKLCLTHARNAWQRLGAMPTEEAMQNYIDIVDEVFPSWASGSPKVTSNQSQLTPIHFQNDFLYSLE